MLKAFVKLPPDIQDDISEEFQSLYSRTDDGGFVKAILDEAKFHGIDPDLPERFHEMRSHLERAFWVFLHRKEQYWDGANVFWRVDKLAPGQWQKRGKLPARPGPLDDSAVENLRQALIEYFKTNEARGRNCQIEAYRRDAAEIFYAYPEDYKKTVSEFIGDKLEKRTIQPAFEIIFVHNDDRRTLDIHIEGDSATTAKLQVIFARSVLGEDIEEDYDDDDPVYELQPLLSRSFEFAWGDDLGIEQVAIKVMRIVIDGEVWQRVTVEAQAIADPKAIYDLLEKVVTKLPKRGLRVDQAQLTVKFEKGARDRRPPRRTIVITTPHTCRMTNDALGEKVHRMLVQSGLEKPGTSNAPTPSTSA